MCKKYKTGIFKLLVYIILLFILSESYGQEKKAYRLACIAFYNLENLFDTIDNPEKNDDEFTPAGSNRWTADIYAEKLNNMAHVISLLGTEVTPDGAAVAGVCEVENRSVLEDLVATEALKNRNYRIVHYESPDYRGIDNALLYQPKYFSLLNTKSYVLTIEGLDDFRTRSQLVVSGIFDGDTIHFIVNHWPSRRGGEQRSRPRRIEAARLSRSIIDSIQEKDEDAKIIIMGDFNDNPNDLSVKKYLNTTGNESRVSESQLYNPFAEMYKKGVGTSAYRDVWSLFDQIIISKSLLGDDYSSYRFNAAAVFNKDFLIQQEGRYKGYPYRTYGSGVYLGGYSDHFPVYIFLVKELR